MSFAILILLALLPAGCIAPAAAPSAALPTATPVVTLSGAIRRPTPPILPAEETPTPSAAMTVTQETGARALLTPTATLEAPGLVLLPTITPSPAASAMLTPAASSNLTATAALPDSYRAQGTFASTTRFADGTEQIQTGEFEITHVQAANAYGANQAYQLTTISSDGAADTVVVYQIDEHVAVHFDDGEWIVLERDAESGLVQAIQPITDLANSFAAVSAQAQFVGIEEVNGIAARRLRLDDPAAARQLFARSLFQPSGQIASLQFDIWLAESDAAVLRYTFDVAISGAVVLNPALQQVSADQQVSWSFDVLDVDGDLALAWPEEAPTPGVLAVPGFAPNEFPIPPGSEVVSTYVGLPELESPLGVEELSAFYQDALGALGWTLEGGFGLFLCSKDEVSFQLLLVEQETGGSKITILPAD